MHHGSSAHGDDSILRGPAGRSRTELVLALQGGVVLALMAISQ